MSWIKKTSISVNLSSIFKKPMPIISSIFNNKNSKKPEILLMSMPKPPSYEYLQDDPEITSEQQDDEKDPVDKENSDHVEVDFTKFEKAGLLGRPPEAMLEEQDFKERVDRAKTEGREEDLDLEMFDGSYLDPNFFALNLPKIEETTKKDILYHIRRAVKNGMIAYWLLRGIAEIYGATPIFPLRVAACTLPPFLYALEKILPENAPIPEFFSSKSYAAFFETSLLSFHLLDYIADIIAFLVKENAADNVILQTILLTVSFFTGGVHASLLHSLKKPNQPIEMQALSAETYPESDEENGLAQDYFLDQDSVRKDCWASFQETCGKYTGFSSLTRYIRKHYNHWYDALYPEEQLRWKEWTGRLQRTGNSVAQVNFIFEIYRETALASPLIRVPSLLATAGTTLKFVNLLLKGNPRPLEGWERGRTATFDFSLLFAMVAMTINTLYGVPPDGDDKPIALLIGAMAGAGLASLDFILEQITPTDKADMISHYSSTMAALHEQQQKGREKNTSALQQRIMTTVQNILTRYKAEFMKLGIEESKIDELIERCKNKMTEITADEESISPDRAIPPPPKPRFFAGPHTKFLCPCCHTASKSEESERSQQTYAPDQNSVDKLI